MTQGNNLKYFSCKEIIAKIMGDFGISSNTYSAYLYDWIGEAIQGIGFHANLIVKQCDVDITEHRGEFPCDAYNIIGVKYNGYRLPLGADISLWGIIDWSKTSNATNTQVSNQDVVSLEKNMALLQTLQAEYNAIILAGNLPTTAVAQAKQTQINDLILSLESVTANFYLGSYQNSFSGDYYNTDTDGFVTSFATGTISVIYNAFPTDSEGFPIFPDTYKYKEAVTMYCMYRLLLRGVKHPIMNMLSRDEYTNPAIAWEKYRAKAANEGKVLSQDGYMKFTNQSNNIRKFQNGWDSFFIHNEQNSGTYI